MAYAAAGTGQTVQRCYDHLRVRLVQPFTEPNHAQLYAQEQSQSSRVCTVGLVRVKNSLPHDWRLHPVKPPRPPADTTYNGMYGQWSIDEYDIREVTAYRACVNIAAGGVLALHVWAHLVA